MGKQNIVKGSTYKVDSPNTKKAEVNKRMKAFLNKKQKLNFIFAPRQSTKSTSVRHHIIDQAIIPGRRILLCYSKIDTVRHVYNEIHRALKDHKRLSIASMDAKSITFENSTMIIFTTFDSLSNAVRGAGVDLLVLEDVNCIKNDLFEVVWNTIYPVVSSRASSRIIITSGTMYTDTKLYKIYTEWKKQNENNILKIKASDAFDSGTLKNIKRILKSDLAYKIEYGVTFIKREEQTFWDKVKHFFLSLSFIKP